MAQAVGAPPGAALWRGRVRGSCARRVLKRGSAVVGGRRQVVCVAGECAFKSVRRGWNAFVRGCVGWGV